MRFIAKLIVWFVAISVGITVLYRFVPPPVTFTMLADGNGLTKDWEPLSRIDRNMVAAVIAAEDGKFCSHNGFDTEAIEKAMERNAKGERLRGGSTISQQTAKNVFLWQGEGWSRYLRKGLEVWFTFLIELTWSKRRIMEAYLNIAEWGPGVFGIEAAAQHHFGVSAGELTQREAARLAVILPNPREFHATASTGHVVRQAGIVERRIGQLGPLLDCVK